MTNSKSARFPRLEDVDMTASQRLVADKILESRKTLGGPFCIMLRRPELADLFQQIGAYTRFQAPAPQHLKEFAVMMVARFWNAEFEWHAHRALAEKAGLKPEQSEAISFGMRPDNLQTDEDLVYSFVGQLLTCGQVSDDVYTRMLRRFGEEIVVDFIALVGYYSTVSFFLNVGQVPPPEGAAPLPPRPKTLFSDAAEDILSN